MSLRIKLRLCSRWYEVELSSRQNAWDPSLSHFYLIWVQTDACNRGLWRLETSHGARRQLLQLFLRETVWRTSSLGTFLCGVCGVRSRREFRSTLRTNRSVATSRETDSRPRFYSLERRPILVVIVEVRHVGCSEPFASFVLMVTVGTVRPAHIGRRLRCSAMKMLPSDRNRHLI